MLKIFSILFLFSFELQAQQVISLYRGNSFKTFVSIPFRVQNSLAQAARIVSVVLVEGKDECRAMVDPNIASNFMIKCNNPASVVADIYFDNAGVTQKIHYGPLSITAISANGVVVPPPPTGDPYKAGRELFAAKCMSCHQSPYEKPNKTANKIRDAINTVGQMSGLRTLTDAQVQAISSYLNHLD